jgi:hypothetical protein
LPAPGLGGDLFAAPLMVPELPRRRRWGRLLLWTLLVFAGGVAAGPTLTDQALVLIERAYAMLGRSPPDFAEKLKPAASTPTLGAAAEPVAPQAAKPAEPEKPAAAVAPQPAARVETAPAPGRAETAVADMPVARPHRGKNEAKTSSAKAAPSRTTPSTRDPAPEAAGFRDPFVGDDGRANEPETAAPSRKSKPSSDDPAPAARSEPAPKLAASGSHDSLDSLMADVVTDKKGKDKPREGKGLDAMLKDVQASGSAPPPKREAPAQLPPLSQADISRVMAGVKARGKDCARQLGQSGIAELKLVVGKDGGVSNVSVGGKLANTPVGGCIEKAARAAAFPQSAGLRFDYRIDVR